MASERPNQTAVDYVTIVLSPVLIMGLIGSLVFFLLEIFYATDGPWKTRLQWILFCFVFGAVLVGRISMMGGIAPRAKLYGIALAATTYFALGAFVEYPEGVRPISFLINLLLVGLVWWYAHRLAWDCTNVDEDTDMSGEGLLQASGLEEKPAKKPDDDEPELLEEDKSGGFAGWWRRYQRYKEQKNKKRTLGTWVIYFSLAALPIYGLGQALIPVSAPDRRRWAFWLMTVYVACGLGLLLTTCFLGLRRYLRQKRLMMPAAMTGAWLGLGATLLVGLLVVGAVLPRPYAETTTLTNVFDPAGSAKRKASRFSPKGDSPAEGEGQPGQARKDGKAQGDKSGEKGEGEAKGQDKDGKGSGKGDDKGDGKGEKKGDSGGEKGKSDRSDDRSKSKEKSSQREQQKGGRSSTQAKQEDSRESKQESRQSSSSSSTNAIQQVIQRVSPVLKWIVFAVLAVVVLVALFRGGLGFLANFTDWAKRLLEAWKNFWASLFGKPKEEEQPQDGEEETAAEQSERVVPFSAFSNPFDSGRAERKSARELVRYTFRATEAWARERDLGRRPGETALEFLDRVGDEVPALEAEAKRLGQLHARAEYARGGLPANTAEQLRAFWEKLERVVEAPLSA
jgi:hypothetical protein